MKKRIVLLVFTPLLFAMTLLAVYFLFCEAISLKNYLQYYYSTYSREVRNIFPKGYLANTFFYSSLTMAFYLFSAFFYSVFSIRLIRKGNVINEVRYTYEEYKAKRDAEKAKQAADQAEREAAAKEARRAELERDLAELKKTE